MRDAGVCGADGCTEGSSERGGGLSACETMSEKLARERRMDDILKTRRLTALQAIGTDG
jgi:hypothetical protein